MNRVIEIAVSVRDLASDRTRVSAPDSGDISALPHSVACVLARSDKPHDRENEDKERFVVICDIGQANQALADHAPTSPQINADKPLLCALETHGDAGCGVTDRANCACRAPGATIPTLKCWHENVGWLTGEGYGSKENSSDRPPYLSLSPTPGTPLGRSFFAGGGRPYAAAGCTGEAP